MQVEKRHRIRNGGATLFVLCAGTALPLTLTKDNQYVGGSATLWLLWGGAIAAVLISAFATERAAGLWRRFPLRWVGFSGAKVESHAQFAQFMGARITLQNSLETLRSFERDKRVSVLNLRAWARILRKQLQADGFPGLAAEFEVVLNDDAPIESVKERAHHFDLLIMSTLLYDTRLLREMDLA